jgi:nucleoid-associated protein YgaU
MSVASDFPPIVHIPDRARTAAPPSRASRAVRAAHLSVVPQSVRPQRATPQAWSGRVPATGRVRRVNLRHGLGGAADSAYAYSLAAAPAPLRLTRRGLTALTLLVLSIAAAMLLIAHLSASRQAVTPGSLATVTVHQGDTLWSIAQAVAPDRDPRAVVDHLMAANHLSSVTLSAGQTLNVK